jgi:hypothetical protein
LQFRDTSRAEAISEQAFSTLIDAKSGVLWMDSKEKRRFAAEAFAHAMRTGEASAAARAAPCLAPDAIVTGGRVDVVGRDAVIAVVTGAWPSTEIYELGGWSDAEAWGDGVVIRAEFPSAGTPPSLTLAFSFDEHDLITSIEKSYVPSPRPESTPEIPLIVRGLVDNALHNGTPLVVAYVNDEDEPVQSVRGSARVFGPTQISIWLRNRDSGLAKATRRNPKVSLFYRDTKFRTTLVIRGRARVTLDEDVCRRAYNLAPELEQHHDPDRLGVALIIDVVEISGSTQAGGVLVRP